MSDRTDLIGYIAQLLRPPHCDEDRLKIEAETGGIEKSAVGLVGRNSGFKGDQQFRFARQA